MTKQVKPVQTGRALPQEVPWSGKGKVFLEKGTRSNKPDSSVQGTLNPGQHSGPHQSGDNNDDIDRLMYLMNLNLQDRIKRRKNPTNKDKIKGLFGGNR